MGALGGDASNDSVTRSGLRDRLEAIGTDAPPPAAGIDRTSRRRRRTEVGADATALHRRRPQQTKPNLLRRKTHVIQRKHTNEPNLRIAGRGTLAVGSAACQ